MRGDLQGPPCALPGRPTDRHTPCRPTDRHTPLLFSFVFSGKINQTNPTSFPLMSAGWACAKCQPFYFNSFNLCLLKCKQRHETDSKQIHNNSSLTLSHILLINLTKPSGKKNKKTFFSVITSSLHLSLHLPLCPSFLSLCLSPSHSFSYVMNPPLNPVCVSNPSLSSSLLSGDKSTQWSLEGLWCS